MPRRRSLTLRDIASAALAVIDRDGLDGLSMRSVARELRTGAMSLYRYVDDRRRLEELVVASVLDDLDPSVPVAGTWIEQVVVLAERARSTIEARPAVVPLVLAWGQAAPGTARWTDAVGAVLADAGFPPASQEVARQTVLAFVLGSIQLGQGRAAGGDRAPGADQWFRSGLEAVLRGLDDTLEH